MSVDYVLQEERKGAEVKQKGLKSAAGNITPAARGFEKWNFRVLGGLHTHLTHNHIKNCEELWSSIGSFSFSWGKEPIQSNKYKENKRLEA